MDREPKETVFLEAHGEAIFAGRSLEQIVTFFDARFYSPPDFDGVKNTSRIDFTGAHTGFVPPGKRLHWTADSRIPVRLRAFQKIAEETEVRHLSDWLLSYRHCRSAIGRRQAVYVRCCGSHLEVRLRRTSSPCTRVIAKNFLHKRTKAVPGKIHTILTDNGIQFAKREGTEAYWAIPFDRLCDAPGAGHRLTKVNHPWINGLAERMNRTLKEVTVKHYYYQSHDRLKQHLHAFLMACNFAKRLKTLKDLTPYARVNLIDPAAATGEAKSLLEQIKGTFGTAPNMLRAVANSPAALKSMWGAFGALGRGTIGPKLGEKIAAAVADRDACSYCLAAHTLLGKNAGASGEEMADAYAGRSAGPKTAAALASSR
jgi:AhpD family alkylhydroperoxidase